MTNATKFVRNVRIRPNRTLSDGQVASELSGGYIPRTFRTAPDALLTLTKD